MIKYIRGITMNQAENVPDICWEYIGIVGFMMDHPGLVWMDDRRVKCHMRLAKHYKLDINRTTIITDHMFDENGELKDGVWLHETLSELRLKFLKEYEKNKIMT